MYTESRDLNMNQLLQHTDMYQYVQEILPTSDKLGESNHLVVLHYISGEDSIKWTTRKRDILKQRAHMRMLENFMAVMLSDKMLQKLLMGARIGASHVVVEGLRYYGEDHGWVNFVCNIGLSHVSFIEYE